MGNQPNYYELLELEDKTHDVDLSAREVKTAYRRALLLYHPDKKTNNGPVSARPSVTVDDIALAYKTLSEPRLKAEYDRWLRSNSQDPSIGAVNKPHHTGLETVDLDDLSFDPETSFWSRDCRCGDPKGFLVSEAELEKNAEDGELIVGCKGCSLWLRVLFGVEE